jgi:hypothetical protein
MVPPKAISSGNTRVQNGGGGNLGANPIVAQLYHAARLVGVGNRFCVTLVRSCVLHCHVTKVPMRAIGEKNAVMLMLGSLIAK